MRAPSLPLPLPGRSPAAPPPRRTATEGAVLELLVLAAGVELFGVDLASGALVRVPGATIAADGEPIAAWDVVGIELRDEPPLPEAPEAVVAADAPVWLGTVPARRAERYLRKLTDPPTEQLLGFAGPSVPYWTLRGERPSVMLVTPAAGPVVVRTERGWRCRFAWRGRHQDLPVVDEQLLAARDRTRPGRILVALTAPVEGHCYKAAVAILPRR